MYTIELKLYVFMRMKERKKKEEKKTLPGSKYTM